MIDTICEKDKIAQSAAPRRVKIASHIETLPAYTPIEPFEVLSARLGRSPDQIVKLDANENPYGPSPKIRQVLAEAPFLHIYPDPESRALRQELSAFTGVPEEFLLASSGADELIDLLLRVFLEPGDYVLTCPPTFGMYAFDTHLNAGRVIEAPRREDFSPDLDAIRKAVTEYRPKLLFLANPNNPDGSLMSSEMIAELLDLPLLLVLDEAYVDFTGKGYLGKDATWITKVAERENLAVLRTFSKLAGLAGLRAGYGAFPQWLMPVLWKAKQPYNVNVAASTAAIASLQDIDYLGQVVERLVSERDRLIRELNRLPFLQAYPSFSNFVLCRVDEDQTAGGLSAAAIKEALARQGILVRYFNTPLLKNHIRISAGRPQETDILLEALWRLACK